MLALEFYSLFRVVSTHHSQEVTLWRNWLMYTLVVTLETAVDNTDSHKIYIVALELLLIK